MRAHTTYLPLLAFAVMVTAVVLTRTPEPEPQHYYATLVGRELVWHSSPQAETGKAEAEVPQVWNYAVPRIAANLEGDLSPVMYAPNRWFDFPPFELRPEPAQQAQVLVEPARAPLPQIASVPVAGDAYENMRGWLRAAGAPEEWIPDLVAIGWCESRGNPLAWNTNNEDSRGVWQLWAGWFPAAGYPLEQWTDPVVNAATAVYVRTERGRYGGKGGWSCADHLGIY